MAVRFDQSDSVTGADHRNANQTTTTTTMEFQRKTNRLSHWTPAVNRNGIPAGIKLKVFFLKKDSGRNSDSARSSASRFFPCQFVCDGR